MYDENQGRRRHHHGGVPKSGKGIHITFFVFHAIAIMLAVGMFVVANTAQVEEKNTMGDIELNVTGGMAMIYDICASFLILAVVVGLLAQLMKRPFLYLMYCVLMSVIALAQLSAAGTCFGKMHGNELMTDRLMELMMDYGNSNHENSAQMTRAWDSLQEKYKCCGVKNYMDWQSVDFGLTSLKVPTSCCLKAKRALKQAEAKYCGQNMLPDNPKAHESIYVEGCLGKVMSTLDHQLFIFGVVGCIVAFFNVVTVTFACFLVITKRV